MDRRSFLALLAGSFTLKLLPMSGVAKEVFAKLPPFDPYKVRWMSWVPWPDQPYIVSKGIIHVVHTCRCGREFHGIHGTAVVREEELGKPLGMLSFMRKMDEAKESAKARAIETMREIWTETQASGLVRHEGCPLQPEVTV